MLPDWFIKKEVKTWVEPRIKPAGVLSDMLWADWEKTVKATKFKSVTEANDRLRRAHECLTWGGFNLGNYDIEAAKKYCDDRATNTRGILKEFPFDKSRSEVEKIITNVAQLKEHGMQLKNIKDPLGALDYLTGMYERVCNPEWWLGKLKRAQKKAIESVARDYGMVNKYRGAYVSDLSLNMRKKESAKNKRLLEDLWAINEHGECYTLAEMQAASVSNPDIRRAELMSRIRGFEIMAEQQKHCAVFWTMTCPSRFHKFSVDGRRNKKNNGENIKDAQNYLNSLWAAFRSWCSRNGINFYGFRVAEPNHDGCPHWHILAFGDEKGLKAATRELGERALRVDGGEAGAKKHRFTTKWLHSGETKDGRKLSAAGYIAKYIAKSIDGFAGEGDTSLGEDGKRIDMGQDSATGAERVVGWSRSNGIRQFQQIGGAYVSVWREIRKLRGHCEDDDALEIVEAVEEKMQVDAAVAWAVFNYMNGAGKNQRLKLWRDDLRPDTHNIVFEKWVVKETSSPLDFPLKKVYQSLFGQYGNFFRNKYGERVSKIKGLMLDGLKPVVTRFCEWRIMKKSEVGWDLDFAP
jgi:hypothetical protein